MSPGIDRRTIGDWNGAGAAAMGTIHVLTHGGGTFPLVGLSFVGLISTTPVFVGGVGLSAAEDTYGIAFATTSDTIRKPLGAA
jgi:hypothetical protein